jgi:hypothetical protein
MLMIGTAVVDSGLLGASYPGAVTCASWEHSFQHHSQSGMLALMGTPRPALNARSRHAIKG